VRNFKHELALVIGLRGRVPRRWQVRQVIRENLGTWHRLSLIVNNSAGDFPRLDTCLVFAIRRACGKYE
jgi:hypothetical protein